MTERVNFFKQYGFDTFIIWPEDLNKKNKLETISKLIEFGD